MGIAVTLARRVALGAEVVSIRRFVYCLQVRSARHRQHSQARSLARRLCPRYGRDGSLAAPRPWSTARCILQPNSGFSGTAFPAGGRGALAAGPCATGGARTRNRSRSPPSERMALGLAIVLGGTGCAEGMARRHIDNLAAWRTISPDMGRTKGSRSSHQTDHHTGAGHRWRLAAFLLLGSRYGERTGIAHVVPGGLDPAIGALDVGDAELVDVAVEGLAMPLTCRPMPSAAELRSIGSVSLIWAIRVPLR